MTTMENIAYAAQYVGFAAAVLLIISVFVKSSSRNMRNSPQVVVGTGWKRPSEYADHRHYLGGLVVPKAMDAQYERQVNEFRRHCRIGKIILKERA